MSLSPTRVLGPVGAGTGGHGDAEWRAWLGTALAEHTVHVACSAGPLPQGLRGNCTGSPAGTWSGQEIGLPCSCQQQPTFGLVSLYSELMQVLTGGSYPVALRASGVLRQVGSCSRRSTSARQQGHLGRNLSLSISQYLQTSLSPCSISSPPTASSLLLS